jgi:hypothetical protein
MRNGRVRDVAAFFRLLATFAVASVGGSMNSTQNRVLQSMTVSPASADAQTFPQGQVQFTATGTFSQAPAPSPATLLWGRTCQRGFPAQASSRVRRRYEKAYSNLILSPATTECFLNLTSLWSE